MGLGRSGKVAAAAAAVLCATVVLAGCGADSSATEAAGTGYVAGDGSAVVLAEAERGEAPVISGPTLTGGTWSSDDARGDVVVVNVWASWCAPCRAEAPTLETSYQAHQGQGVQFVGINTRDTDAAADAFVARYGITYPNIVDADGQVQLRLRETLPPQSIPSTLFLDRQGRVAARVLGEVDATRLNGIIETLAAEPAA